MINRKNGVTRIEDIHQTNTELPYSEDVQDQERRDHIIGMKNHYQLYYTASIPETF